MILSNADRKVSQYFSTVVHGVGYKPFGSRNFRLSEFQSRDGEHVVLVHPMLVDGAEALREFYGPYTFARAYSSDRHNAAIGGAPGSRHRFGTAIDPSVQRDEQCAIAADEMGWGGIGVGLGRLHLDVEGSGRRWLYVMEGGSVTVKVLPVDEWRKAVLAARN